jgi:hypothetical protein
VAYVIVLLGVNDIGKSSTNQPVSAAQIIAGYVQLVARAHTQKLKYLGCTLTPFGRSVYDKPGNESIREVVNAYIRTNSIFDGMIDFDAAVRDPAAQANLLTNYDSGDHLHLNDAGYQAMAAAVNLSLLQGGVASSYQPDLASTLAGDGTLTVNWPAAPGGFLLLETDSPLPPVVWQISPLTPVLSNGVFSFSIHPSGFSPRFFRLVTTP